MDTGELNGDQLVQVLATLASPHRLRVLATLTAGRMYVSRLAREIGISRALLQVHLKRLEKAGLVSAQLEFSADGKAMKYYEVTPFSLHLTPQTLAAAAASLTDDTTTGAVPGGPAHPTHPAHPVEAQPVERDGHPEGTE